MARSSHALVVGVLALATLLAGMLAPVPNPQVLAATNASTISGTVTIAGGATPVSDARVIATGSEGRVGDATDGSGSYTLSGLQPGTYELTVRPATVSTVSPTWVFTAGAVLVNVPPDTTQTLVVEPATVTVNGKLIAPTGNDFSGANAAFVRAENQEGQGNTVQVQTNGTFSVRGLPGPILLSFTFANQNWTSPITLRGSVYYAQPGDTIDAGQFSLLVKDRTISGTVTIVGGSTAPAGTPVRAWRLDGTEFVQTTTGAGGVYSMQVISGTWLLRAVPLADQPYGGVYYVPAQSPQRVTLGASTNAATQNLLIAAADIQINGRAIDRSGNPLTTGVDGRAYALYRSSDGRPVYGPTARLSDGTFTLRLASSLATTYTVGLFFPYDVGYTALARPVVNTGSIPDPLDIPVAVDNSHIRGALKSQTGSVVTGLPGAVWAVSNSGGWARTRVNPLDGQYDLPVVSTDLRGAGGSFWQVRAFVDPTTGYLVQRSRVQQVFLPYNGGEGADVTVDFTVAEPDSLIRGTVTLPGATTEDALPAASGRTGIVRVVVRQLAGEGTEAFERSVYTGPDGGFRVRVPSGIYQVRVFADQLRPGPWIPPAPLLVTAPAGGQVVTNPQFRSADALVTGQVRFNGAGQAALVRALSSDGVTVRTAAGPNGNFNLRLRQGLSWTIEAVAGVNTDFLRSNRVTVALAQPLTALGAPLVLQVAETMPDGGAFLFDTTQDQLFSFANGSQLSVPAGAMAEGGNALLLVTPLPELAADGGAQPVSFGYRLKAFDDARRPITSFARPVTLLIPFTAEQLQTLGVTTGQLIPSYWDEASASWKPVENVSVVPDDSGGGTVNIVVEHFTDFALLAVPGGSTYIALVSR
jgi:hypothetical protein